MPPFFPPGLPPDSLPGQLVALLAAASEQELGLALNSVTCWRSLLDFAVRAKLVLPIQVCLEAAPESSVPPEVISALSSLGTQRSLQALQLARHLKEVLGWLEQAGVPVLAYKGPTLALMAFGHLGSRESCDLDLLVRPADYRRAARLLQDRGFEFVYPPPTRCQLMQAYEVSLVHQERGISVDLHRAFFSSAVEFELDLERHRAHSVRMLGCAVPTLAPDELLLLLGVHGAKHCWRELRWVHDLHGLLSRQTFHWGELWERARTEGAVRSLSSGLTLAHLLFGTDLPREFEPDPTTLGLVDCSLRYLSGEPADLPAQHLYHWRVADRIGQRLRYLLWTLFRPHELDLAYLDLPEWCWPLYYLVRPYRLLRQRCRGRRPHADSQ